MKTRKLGNQGLVASVLGLGCIGMSIAYGAADETEALFYFFDDRIIRNS